MCWLMDVNDTCSAVHLIWESQNQLAHVSSALWNRNYGTSGRIESHFLIWENSLSVLFPNLRVYFWNKCLLSHGLLNLLQVCEGVLPALENRFETPAISLNWLGLTSSPFGIESYQIALFYYFSDQKSFITGNLMLNL